MLKLMHISEPALVSVSSERFGVSSGHNFFLHALPNFFSKSVWRTCVLVTAFYSHYCFFQDLELSPYFLQLKRLPLLDAMGRASFVPSYALRSLLLLLVFDEKNKNKRRRLHLWWWVKASAGYLKNSECLLSKEDIYKKKRASFLFMLSEWTS